MNVLNSKIAKSEELQAEIERLKVENQALRKGLELLEDGLLAAAVNAASMAREVKALAARVMQLTGGGEQ